MSAAYTLARYSVAGRSRQSASAAPDPAFAAAACAADDQSAVELSRAGWLAHGELHVRAARQREQRLLEHDVGACT